MRKIRKVLCGWWPGNKRRGSTTEDARLRKNNTLTMVVELTSESQQRRARLDVSDELLLIYDKALVENATQREKRFRLVLLDELERPKRRIDFAVLSPTEPTSTLRESSFSDETKAQPSEPRRDDFKTDEEVEMVRETVTKDVVEISSASHVPNVNSHLEQGSSSSSSRDSRLDLCDEASSVCEETVEGFAEQEEPESIAVSPAFEAAVLPSEDVLGVAGKKQPLDRSVLVEESEPHVRARQFARQVSNPLDDRKPSQLLAIEMMEEERRRRLFWSNFSIRPRGSFVYYYSQQKETRFLLETPQISRRSSIKAIENELLRQRSMLDQVVM